MCRHHKTYSYDNIVHAYSSVVTGKSLARRSDSRTADRFSIRFARKQQHVVEKSQRLCVHETRMLYACLHFFFTLSFHSFAAIAAFDFRSPVNNNNYISCQELEDLWTYYCNCLVWTWKSFTVCYFFSSVFFTLLRPLSPLHCVDKLECSKTPWGLRT